MFRRFHKLKKTTVTCPYCGSTQEEPSMAVSTFCRACGEHFRIQKGVAMASPGLRVSGISEIATGKKSSSRLPFDWAKPSDSTEAENEDSQEVSEDAWMASPDEKGGSPQPLPEPLNPDEESPVGISAGAFFGLVDEDEVETDSEPSEIKNIGDESQSADKLAEGSMEAMIGSQDPDAAPETTKMPPNYVPPEKRKKASDNGSTFDVRCFRCYHIQAVSRFAKSTQCERCNVYITLANYEVKSHKSHSLRTRGDITISRRGGLKNCEIACHHLNVNGTINVTADCSGDVSLRHSGVIRGHLYCRRLLIEKNCEVEFPDGVMVQRADINGTLKGNVTCSGQVKIGKSGSVDGDVHAVDISIKDGGSITGKMETDPETSTELPVKKGTNPSIIG